MYYDDCTYRRGNRTYRRDLLRESYRVGGKVVKRTVANITPWPAGVKRAIREELAAGRRGPGKVAGAGATDGAGMLAAVAAREGFGLEQGDSVGAVWLLHELAQRTGVAAALGRDRAGKLALWQVLARTLEQGSRLSAVRLARTQAVGAVLGLGEFSEDDLYANLDWLAAHQEGIEDRLFRARYGVGGKPELFLYDVTSSYFEGTQNELAAFGYNRDGKKGKKQLVVGALTDQAGWPLSVEAFRGNTNDPATVASQVTKLAGRFGGGEVTLVGDRGMLKGPQLADLAAHGMHYLTAITKPQIEALLGSGTLQLELFDEELAEVADLAAGVRYVIRRNPAQTWRLADRRADQLATWEGRLAARNTYLAAHPRAQVATALQTLTGLAGRLKLSSWLSPQAEGRTLRAVMDASARAEVAKLDGCYVLKTDLKPAQATKETLDARYRSLAQVEREFRTSKTAHLEQRPVYVRRESRTRGHLLVVMLAYCLVNDLTARWAGLDVTVREGLHELRELCLTELVLPTGARLAEIPRPRPSSQRLLAAAGVELPTLLPAPTADVDTKRKLQARRNQR